MPNFWHFCKKGTTMKAKEDMNKEQLSFYEDITTKYDLCLVRQPIATVITSVAKSSIPNTIEEDDFPEPVHWGERNRAWVLQELYAWIQNLIDVRDKKIAQNIKNKKEVN